MLSTMKDQAGATFLIAEVYRSMLTSLNLSIDYDYVLPQIGQALEGVYDNQGLTFEKHLRPLTQEEEFILAADFTLTDFRVSIMDKITASGSNNCLDIENGSAVTIVNALGSELMQNFLGVMTVTAAKEYNLQDEVPLFSYMDGKFQLSLFHYADTKQEDHLTALKKLGVDTTKLATSYPKMSKYNN